MSTTQPLAISIMGPTASGKTAVAVALTKALPCEIISVDSALIYKGMNIGTAKPSREQLLAAPHRLIDLVDPSERYSVADFRVDALREMAEITARGKIPLLVGGTMLYFKSLIDGIAQLPKADPNVRRAIAQEAERVGWLTLHQQLEGYDSDSAQRIHPNDPQRLTRAIEVYRLTGRTMTSLMMANSQPAPYEFYQFAIAPNERSVLHELIAKRFQQMLHGGFEDEVRQLRARGDLHLDLPSMRCVGYRQMWQHLAGELSFQVMQDKAIAATRQLAKRQLTWLRGWRGLHWLDTRDPHKLEAVIQRLGSKSM